MSDLIFVLNGSNLNMLGHREPQIYGNTTLPQIEERTVELAKGLGYECVFRQTNSESQLIDWIQEAYFKDARLIINPAGFSFGRIPVLDAVKLIKRPVIEVHLTNIHRRTHEYNNSSISVAATAVICGAGPIGYELALRTIAEIDERSYT